MLVDELMMMRRRMMMIGDYCRRMNRED